LFTITKKKKALAIFGKNSPLSSHNKEKEFKLVIFKPKYIIFVSMFKDVLFDDAFPSSLLGSS
jgi:hypothetical protein